MANNFATDIWCIDTPSPPGVPFMVQPIQIAAIKWVTSSDGVEGDSVICTDGQGNQIWEGSASGANYDSGVQIFGVMGWVTPNGFAVPTLTRGHLYVYVAVGTI